MKVDPTEFKPLDPGRVNLIDPIEVRHWCTELHCTEDQLRAAAAQAGEHVTAIREHLGKQR